MKSSKSVFLFAALLAAGPLPAAETSLSEAQIKEAWECAAGSAGAIQIYEDEGNPGNAEGAKEAFHWWAGKLGSLYNEGTLIEWVKKIQYAPFHEIKSKAVLCSRIARGLTPEQMAAEEKRNQARIDQQRAEAERRQREQAEYQAQQQAELSGRCTRLADSSTRLAMNVYENALDEIANPSSSGWSSSILSPGCSGIRNAINQASSMGCPREVVDSLQRYYNQYYISLPSGNTVGCR